jgi:malonate transporter and related proteins
MTDLLLLFVPFFALVLMGWGAARSGLLPLDGIPTMNTFVLFFGLPAMIFRLGASGALHQSGLGGLLLAYGLAGAVVVGLGLAWGIHQGLRRRDSGLAALVTAFPNTGFLGLPLLTGLLGAGAAGPVAATLIVDVLVLSSVCLAWAHSHPHPHPLAEGPAQDQNDDPLHAAMASLKGALRNPLLWALGVGMAFGQWGWHLPKAADETLRLLGLSATPAALFTLGAILARAQLKAAKSEPAAVSANAPRSTQRSKESQEESRVGALPVWVPAVCKLALHPALVWVCGSALVALGVDVPRAGLITLTMAAALPSASNVSMLSEREGANTTLVARIILWSTGAALITLALWAHGLGVQPAAVTT